MLRAPADAPTITEGSRPQRRLETLQTVIVHAADNTSKDVDLQPVILHTEISLEWFSPPKLFPPVSKLGLAP